MAVPRFEGFPAGTLPWFRKLARNNDREWFAPRKAEYEALAVAPMLLLLDELTGRLHEAGLPLAPSRRSPVFRIYRDIRFSNDKTPFKTNMGSALHRDGSKAKDGILYIHIDPKGSFAAAGFWQPEKVSLGRWREWIAADPKPLLRLAESLTLDRTDSLMRMPRGFERFADTPAAPLLRLKSFITQQELDPALLGSRQLVSVLLGFAQKAEPLLRYGWALESAFPARAQMFSTV